MNKTIIAILIIYILFGLSSRRHWERECLVDQQGAPYTHPNGKQICQVLGIISWQVGEFPNNSWRLEIKLKNN